MNSTFRYLLLLGGNLGNVEATFDDVVGRLASLGIVGQKSAIYYSRAWGFESDDIFRNAVVELHSSMAPSEMLEELKTLERMAGRTKKSTDGGYASRTIDIDILFCNDLIIRQSQLVIPHPRLHLRRFTLVPLCEKWKELIHPVFMKDMQTLLDECPDTADVWATSPSV